MEIGQDWIDGFLVVGNQPVLDLLNTKLLTGGTEQELLTDTQTLVRWLRVTALATASLSDRLSAWSDEPEARKFLWDLLLFREVLRTAVLAMEMGEQPDSNFLADLNLRLLTHPVRLALTAGKPGLQTVQAEGTSIADTLWASILRALVDLFTKTDRTRVRKGENCVVHFEDTSKKNARRWCSMRLCGNRLKVAAYQKRQRTSAN